MRKTVAGVFERFLLAEDAIRDLEKAGIPRDDISIATADAKNAGGEAGDTGVGAGAAIGGVAGLALGLSALAIPGAGPILAAGPLAAALASAGIGAAAGGFLGALTGMHVPEYDAGYYAEAVRKGGAVVMVHAESDSAETAREVLNQAGAQNVGEEDPRSSEPNAPQVTLSGARIYKAGLEMNPRKSRFEDTTSPISE
ncbi:MAG: hypothetical protein ACR2NN_02495 [Bryobacteraceae bacterium]